MRQPEAPSSRKLGSQDGTFRPRLGCRFRAINGYPADTAGWLPGTDIGAATPHLDEAADEIGDTLFLTLRAGLDTVCVARRLGSYPIQVLVLGAGVRRPIGFSASGIALLASMPPPAARRIAVQNRVHLRANGATVESAIVATAKARKLGYAFRERGIVPGTRAVSIAFGNRDGEALATLTVTAIARRMQAPRVKSIVDRLKVCAADIERSLGAQPG